MAATRYSKTACLSGAGEKARQSGDELHGRRFEGALAQAACVPLQLPRSVPARRTRPARRSARLQPRKKAHGHLRASSATGLACSLASAILAICLAGPPRVACNCERSRCACSERCVRGKPGDQAHGDHAGLQAGPNATPRRCMGHARGRASLRYCYQSPGRLRCVTRNATLP